jgi:hypothetical protein
MFLAGVLLTGFVAIVLAWYVAQRLDRQAGRWLKVLPKTPRP